MAKRKKNLSITDTIAQHLETTNPETVVTPEVIEEKIQPALDEEPKETKVIEKKEEKIEAKKEEAVKKEEPKEEILTSPHYKDPATSIINFGISSVL